MTALIVTVAFILGLLVGWGACALFCMAADAEEGEHDPYGL